MINIHSISFKFSGAILTASLLFLIIVSMLTTRLTIEQYENIIHDKLASTVENVSSTLGLNLSFGFEKAIKETAENLYKDSNILLVCIQDKNEKKLRYSRSDMTFDAYKKLHHFSIERELLDPVSREEIGEIKLIYSRTVFDEMMQKYYEKLGVVVGLYIIFLILLSLFLYRTILPLTTLANKMNSFDPKKSQFFLFKKDDKSEIGLISKASNTMVQSIKSYLFKLQALQDAAVQREHHLNDAQRMAHVGSWEYILNKNEFKMSRELLRILGINAKNHSASWSDFLHYIHEEDRVYTENIFVEAVEKGSRFNLKYRCVKSNGNVVYIHTQGKVRKRKDGTEKMTGVSMDITEQHHSQETIEKLAYYDPLTELPNRVLFKNRLQKAIAASTRHENMVAVFFIDLDKFKLINDSLGHMVGDELLRKVAEILVDNLREEDTVSRLGGDEFTILLPNTKDIQSVEVIAKKLLSSINKRLRIGKHELHISLSMGIATYPNHGSTPDELIKNADTAMYKAKELGRNNYQFYQTQMGVYVTHQLSLEQDFRQAVTSQSDELKLYYQAKMDFKTLKVHGAEALIRWQHPTKGLLFPDSFIPLAESTGLIVELGAWIIEEAIRQVLVWQEKFSQDIQVSINLSARQFQDKNLVPLIKSLMDKYGVNPSLLEFEITESISMSNIADNLIIMGELKALGVALAIDDFGTGYSSLAYLKQFPVDTLKIDKSFVMDMLDDPDDKVIVSTIISMSKALGLATVAEGVETQAHAEALQELECDIAQGYLYSKAISKEDFLTFVSRSRES